MSDLLLNHNLRQSKSGDEVRQVARIRTLTTLRRLDASRNKTVLQFLQDANLLGGKDAVINLSDADLSYDDLCNTNLSGTDLSHADLSYTDLNYADLSHADLSGAILIGANLDGTDLSHADLSGAILIDADLRHAVLSQVQLEHVQSLRGAIMPNGSKHS
jgi:uncharacterized protein YjbI with pentapeptide repeats